MTPKRSTLLFNSVLLAFTVQTHKASDTLHNTLRNAFNQRVESIRQNQTIARLPLLLKLNSVQANREEIIAIRATATQLKARINAFERAIHRSPDELKLSLQVIHQQALSPLPDIMTRFLCGRIINGTARPTTHVHDLMSQMAALDPDRATVSSVHQHWQQLLRSYKKRLRKSYPPHQKSPTRKLMYEEYRECIVPFVDCLGVFARFEKENPAALEHAIMIFQDIQK